jgi:hypothetical protein
MAPEKLSLDELKNKVKVINRINDTICSHSEIFDVSVLAFHLRIYRHNFKSFSNSKLKLDFLEELNESFSKFVVTYFQCLNIYNSQKVLYDLIHQDPKSEFLVALDNNISQLSE